MSENFTQVGTIPERYYAVIVADQCLPGGRISFEAGTRAQVYRAVLSLEETVTSCRRDLWDAMSDEEHIKALRG